MGIYRKRVSTQIIGIRSTGFEITRISVTMFEAVLRHAASDNPCYLNLPTSRVKAQQIDITSISYRRTQSTSRQLVFSLPSSFSPRWIAFASAHPARCVPTSTDGPRIQDSKAIARHIASSHRLQESITPTKSDIVT